ncbi:YolD-like family protein [Paenibacillus sp. FSL L8-0436]|uniref:YolD-like family protein n=1 Tax=Paenibacillus sp. FSL L8-0436 TaxID=2954686 RepID=UPI0031588CC6
MGKKLEGNGLWEGSRMMLPEHKLRIISDEQGQEFRDRKKPELDEQRIEEFEQIFAQSIEDHGPITVIVFHPRNDEQIHGIVMKVDRGTRRIKLRTSEEDWDWIKIEDIIECDYIKNTPSVIMVKTPFSRHLKNT